MLGAFLTLILNGIIVEQLSNVQCVNNISDCVGLFQFVEGHKYHFIVRAVDTQKRLGDFSLPGSIILHAAGQPPSAS